MVGWVSARCPGGGVKRVFLEDISGEGTTNHFVGTVAAYYHSVKPSYRQGWSISRLHGYFLARPIPGRWIPTFQSQTVASGATKRPSQSQTVFFQTTLPPAIPAGAGSAGMTSIFLNSGSPLAKPATQAIRTPRRIVENSSRKKEHSW